MRPPSAAQSRAGAVAPAPRGFPVVACPDSIARDTRCLLLTHTSITSRLSFENYGPITTDTPPGSAGNRRDTRTPVWAPARSRSSAEEPGDKSPAAARTPLPAAVLVRTRQRAQAARKQLRAAARRRAAQQRPSDGRRGGSR